MLLIEVIFLENNDTRGANAENLFNGATTPPIFGFSYLLLLSFVILVYFKQNAT